MKRFNSSNLRNKGSVKRAARKPMPIALAAGMALICAHSSAFADAIPATDYDCRGLDLTVEYDTGAIGELLLSVTRGGKPIVKRGDEVRVQKTVLGSLVTIVVANEPDAFTETFTLLAPDVNVPTDNPTVVFPTELFRTYTKTSIGGPALVEGVIQESISQQLSCRASTIIL
ncbi:MAG: hypothetical protein ACREYF_15425 [Gammaproteobacteria bacterium]